MGSETDRLKARRLPAIHTQTVSLHAVQIEMSVAFERCDGAAERMRSARDA